MKKRKPPPIDMTRYGPVMDVSPHGYLDCCENLSEVLYLLYSRRVVPKKRRLIKVIVSTIIGERINRPERVELEKKYSFGYLCREYLLVKGSSFELKEYADRRNWSLEAYEKQGQKEMAWAGYNQYLYIEKAMKHENTISSLPEEEKIKKRDEFGRKNGAGLLRIG